MRHRVISGSAAALAWLAWRNENGENPPAL